MMTFSRLVALLVVLSLSFRTSAFTLADTNHVVDVLLRRALADAVELHQWDDGVKEVNPERRVDTWESFLNGAQIEGWTYEAKKNAFSWYLSTWRTNDCINLPSMEKTLLLTALAQCEVLNFTNSVSAIRSLALNPRGIEKTLAIELSIRLGDIDDATTAFVETILTNRVSFTRSQRGTVCAEYARKLVAATNSPAASFLHAGSMFYRNRHFDSAGAVAIDRAVMACYPSYAASSNRLQTANWVLSRDDCYSQTRKYFSTVTNQLLSSGRPFVQLTIGE